METTAFIRSLQSRDGCVPTTLPKTLPYRKAMLLLEHDNMSIEATSLVCGLQQIAHFDKVFKAETGSPPGVWKKIANLNH